MTDNFDLTNLVSSSSDMNLREEYNYLLTNIPQKVTRKLYGIAIFNILIGIAAIGLDIGLLSRSELTFLTGIINGLYMIFVGIIILILCREEIYVLTNLLILIFFQIFFLLLSLFAYIVLIIIPDNKHDYHFNLLIKNFGIIIILIILCMTIYSLIVIRNGRRRPQHSYTTFYHPHQNMTMENI